MRAGDYWRALKKRIGFEKGIRPDGYEVFNGTIIFWFTDGGKIREVLKKMKEAGVEYQIEWDREEGLVGISLKRELLR